MNENDENVDPMRDAAPDVEHLRLEISENGEVFYRIDDVTLMMLRRCQQLLFSFFFVSKKERKRRRRIFPHFSRPRFSKNGRSCLGLFTLFHALFTLFHVYA